MHIDQIKKTIIEEYWSKKLSGELPEIVLPSIHDVKKENVKKENDKKENTAKSPALTFQLNVPPELTVKLKKITKNSDTGLFILFLSALNIGLHKYTGTEDLLVGILPPTTPTVAGVAGEDGNILFSRTQVAPYLTVKEIINQTKNEVTDAVNYSQFSFANILAELEIKNNNDNNNNYNNNSLEIFKVALVWGTLKRENRFLDRFDLAIALSESNTQIVLTVKYPPSPAAGEMVERFSRNIIHLLAGIVDKPGQQVALLDAVNNEEKQQLLFEFNHTAVDYPQNKTIPELFAEQVERVGDKIAVIDIGQGALTYKELNDKSNGLARLLIEKGVKPDTIVGIMMDRCLEMMVGIFGILKSGGAYLPIDTGYPQERIDYMLKDSGAGILVKKSEIRNSKFETNPNDQKINDPNQNQNRYLGTTLVLNFEHLNFEFVSNFEFRASNFNFSNLAYIIYTSGTTGKPKGVLIEHRNVVRLLFNDQFQFDFNDRDVWTLFHSYSFDFSVWEMYGSLLYGGRLIVIPREIIVDPSRFLEIVTTHGVTVLNQTPSAFYNFINEELKKENKSLKLRFVIFGGDALKPGKLKEWSEKYPQTRLVNMFGITETTVHVTYKEIGKEEIMAEKSNIGSPIPTLSVYIMDRFQRLLPVGAMGELHVGGAGVARGYLNRPELTMEKFVENPFKPGERLYKSGDLVRIIGNGDMEYLGRIDHQVKIRGYRVELGEIESQLLNHPLISDCIVLDRMDGSDGRDSSDSIDGSENKSLCAYYVCKSVGQEIARAELKKHLSQELPDYMIPTYFIAIPKIPLTPNGKLWRKSLPDPGLIIDDAGKYEAPGNKLEKKLVELWAEILGRDALHASQLKTSIGIHDNFFELGGHSLKATTMMSKIHKELDVKIELMEIFKAPTIRDIARLIRGLKKEAFQAIEPVEKKEYYPLSSAQKRLYFLQQLDLNSTGYNIPMILSLGKEITKDKLENTLKQLISRHESLRTSIERVNEDIVQRIHPAECIEFSLDCYDAGKTGIEEIIKNYIRPFDLSRAPLIRSGLIMLPDGHCTWIVDVHHIVSDGTSHTILAENFRQLYEGGTPLAPLPIQYKDFSQWQNQLFSSGGIKEQEDYWLQLYAGEIPRLNLAADYKRPGVFTFEGDHHLFKLEVEDAVKFKTLGARYGGTLYMNMMAALNVLFFKYTGQADIIIGSGIAGRRHADLQGVVGMFINTLAMRNYPEGEKSYEHFLREVITGSASGFENQDIQFEDLVEKLNLERDASRNPVFDIMMIVQNFRKVGEGGGDSGAEYTGMPALDILPATDENPAAGAYKNHTTKFDMTFSVHDQGDDIYINIEYYTAIFKPETIRRIAAHLKNIIKSVVAGSFIKLKDIEMISADEKKKVLYEFNNTERDYPKEKTIQRLFAEQVAQTPDRLALVGSAGIPNDHHISGYHHNHVTQLTYHELNEQSDRLAHLLTAKGILADNIVGIMIERSVEMVIGILGILKVGGAYMPIDPDYPQERIDYMLKDSNAKILINKSEIRNSKFETNLETNPNDQKINDQNKNHHFGTAFVLNLDYLNFEFVSNFEFRASNLLSSNLAYILYTSGSTGKPKGVLVEHRSVIRLVLNNHFVEFSQKLRVLQTGAPVFDAVTFEMWGPLLNGGQLYLEDNEVILDPGKLGKALKKYHINTLWLTSSLFNQLAQQDSAIFSTLEWLVVGGDVLSPGSIAEVRRKNNHLTVVNGYGPTENTTFSVCHRIDRDYEHNIPIGKPIANSCAYILDKNGHLQPPGVPGELYVGGDGLARGYLNNPELTADKFNKDLPPLVAYKTGDLARWLPDGLIEFLGRLDTQLKIRGFRVEPGEIEKRLTCIKEIKEAVVTVLKSEDGSEDGSEDKLLCAYIAGTREFEVTELKEYLGHELPGYMIPTYFVQLKALPLTVNGKVDRQALPAPSLMAGKNYIPPAGDLEEKIVEIWSNVLGIKKEAIGVQDDFFHLGGHSLKAMLLVSQVAKTLNVEFPLIAIFKGPTVREMANTVRRSRGIIYEEIKPVEKKEYYPLASAQKRLFFLEQFENIGVTYNIPSVLKVAGKLDIKRLEEVIDELIRRHETLRTSFHLIHNEPVQIVHETLNFKIEYYNCADSPLPVIKDFIRPFDLSCAPLLHVGVVSLSQEESLLLYDLHHIIGDGTSMGILANDFAALYDGEEIPSLTLQYKDFSAWQNNLFKTGEIEKQAGYWLESFTGEIPVLNLATDYPRPETLSFAGKTIGLRLDEETALALKQFCLESGVTLYMNLLAALNVLLYKYTHQGDIIVGVGIMGRPHADLHRLIGMFVNSLAMRNFPGGEKPYAHFLQEVKETCLKAFANQDVQFEWLVDRLKIKRDSSRNPLFDVLLVVQNFEQSTAFVDQTPNVPREINFSHYPIENKTSKFDLNFSVWEVQNTIMFNLEYASEIFKPSTARKILSDYLDILGQLIKNKDTRLKDVSISYGFQEAEAAGLAAEDSEFGF